MWMSEKIAVVGEADVILCFRAIGLEVFPARAEDAETSRRLVERLAREGYGVLFVTEPVAAAIPETVDRFRGSLAPAVVLIPGSQGSLGIGLRKIQDNVEKAVGRNIL
jgi:V/A-type H+-transporting ATPase subunit F